jgi:hypothetical protein
MDNSAFEPGHTYTPVLAPDGETVYLDNIDTKQLTGGITETQPLSGAVNKDFSNTDQGPTKSCPTQPEIPNLTKMIPKPDRSKGKGPHKLSATQTEPTTPKQGTVQQNDPAPTPPMTPLQKLNATFDPVARQLKTVDTFVDKYSPHYDPTKSGEGVRVIVDSYIYLGGGKLFGWLVGKFGPGLGPLLPKVITKTPKINPEEEVVWVRTNAKEIPVIYREFEEAFYGQGKGEFLKYSEAIAKKAVEKLEQYYKIRGLPYPLAPKL